MIVFALLATQPALAWRHTSFVWDQTLFPLDWYMSVAVEDSLPKEPIYGPKKDLYYQELAVIRAFDAWELGAPCADVDATYGGMSKKIEQSADDNDGTRAFYFDDPTGDVPAGVLAVTYSEPSNTAAFTRFGVTYYLLDDTDIVFNNDVVWATTEDIDDGKCNGGTSVEAVATHEIGHSWGMGHSCEEDELCSDPDLRLATMYWSAGPCSNDQADINEDDSEGITALYGPFATFTSQSPLRGGVPLEVAFEVVENEAKVTRAEWNFGDGTTSTELEPTHTYTEIGQYTVTVTLGGKLKDCGEWSYDEKVLSYVVACGEPIPGLDSEGESFENLFTIEHYDGLVYQLINQTDTSVYGCIESIYWKVMKGDEILSESSAWSPKVEFPNEGKYKIVLEIGGPGGVVTEELDVTAEDKVGEDFKSGVCGTAPGSRGTGAGALALSALAFGLAARRRR